MRRRRCPQNAYVLAGGEILAQQQRLADGTTRLMWQHMNPITGNALTTSGDAEYEGVYTKVTDPAGS